MNIDIHLCPLLRVFERRWSMGLAPLKKRWAALKALHNAGCKTWVSVEPYPTPNIIEHDLKKVLAAVGFVDKIIFGRMNYSTEVTEYKTHKKIFNGCVAEAIK